MPGLCKRQQSPPQHPYPGDAGASPDQVKAESVVISLSRSALVSGLHIHSYLPTSSPPNPSHTQPPAFPSQSAQIFKASRVSQVGRFSLATPSATADFLACMEPHSSSQLAPTQWHSWNTQLQPPLSRLPANSILELTSHLSFCSSPGVLCLLKFTHHPLLHH